MERKKLGKKRIMEQNKIYQGDAQLILQDFQEKTFDCVITDPPFNIGLDKLGSAGFRKKKRPKNYYDEPLLHCLWIPEIYRGLKENTHFYCFSGYDEIVNIITESQKAGFKLEGILVWNKLWPAFLVGNYGFKYAPQSELCCFFSKGKRKLNQPNIADVLTSARVKNIDFPCPKPIDLIETLIIQSTNEGELVLDCFLGSGTTALACQRLKRNWIGIELSKENIKLTEERLKGETRNLF